MRLLAALAKAQGTKMWRHLPPKPKLEGHHGKTNEKKLKKSKARIRGAGTP